MRTRRGNIRRLHQQLLCFPSGLLSQFIVTCLLGACEVQRDRLNSASRNQKADPPDQSAAVFCLRAIEIPINIVHSVWVGGSAALPSGSTFCEPSSKGVYASVRSQLDMPLFARSGSNHGKRTDGSSDMTTHRMSCSAPPAALKPQVMSCVWGR
ncbi:hypothetical protein VTN96DRAFT_9055 [Rasamsonia emersonii]